MDELSAKCSKPINKYQKGKRRQLQARKELESLGWRVYSAAVSLYNLDVDIWGLWDLICYKEGYIKLVQVKSNYCSPEVKQKLLDFHLQSAIVSQDAFCECGYGRGHWVFKEVLCCQSCGKVIKAVTKELWIYKDYDRKSPYIEQV